MEGGLWATMVEASWYSMSLPLHPLCHLLLIQPWVYGRRSSKDPIHSYVYQRLIHTSKETTTYIAYHIILFIGTNYTLYHQLIHCLTIQINQKVTMEHDLNMWTPTKRYIISSYQCYIFELHVTTRLIYMFLKLLGRLKY